MGDINRSIGKMTRDSGMKSAPNRARILLSLDIPSSILYTRFPLYLKTTLLPRQGEVRLFCEPFYRGKNRQVYSDGE